MVRSVTIMKLVSILDPRFSLITLDRTQQLVKSVNSKILKIMAIPEKFHSAARFQTTYKSIRHLAKLTTEARGKCCPTTTHTLALAPASLRKNATIPTSLVVQWTVRFKHWHQDWHLRTS